MIRGILVNIEISKKISNMTIRYPLIELIGVLEARIMVLCTNFGLPTLGLLALWRPETYPIFRSFFY